MSVPVLAVELINEDMKTLHEFLKETKAMMDKCVAEGMKLNQREQGKLELMNSLLKLVDAGKLKP